MMIRFSSNNRKSLCFSALTALAIAGFLSGCASSGSVSDSDRMFLGGAASWDANRDDIVTCDEWKAYAGRLFNKADQNKDGALSEDEFKTLSANDRTFDVANLKYYDVNKNGAVDRTEFVDRPNQAFVLADGDKDCRMTSQELSAARMMGTPKAEVKPMVDPKSGY